MSSDPKEITKAEEEAIEKALRSAYTARRVGRIVSLKPIGFTTAVCVQCNDAPGTIPTYSGGMCCRCVTSRG